MLGLTVKVCCCCDQGFPILLSSSPPPQAGACAGRDRARSCFPADGPSRRFPTRVGEETSGQPERHPVEREQERNEDHSRGRDMWDDEHDKQVETQKDPQGYWQTESSGHPAPGRGHHPTCCVEASRKQASGEARPSGFYLQDGTEQK